MRIAESADGQGRTIWQILTGKNIKKEILNPLNLKTGNMFNIVNDISHPDLKDKNFSVVSREEIIYTFPFSNKENRQILYVLNGESYSGDYLQTSLEADFITIFYVFDELEFDEEFLSLVEDYDQFTIEEDKDGNKLDWLYEIECGHKTYVEYQSEKYVQYLYSRETVRGKEYLKIEKNVDNGMFRLLIGKQVEQKDIIGY